MGVIKGNQRQFIVTSFVDSGETGSHVEEGKSDRGTEEQVQLRRRKRSRDKGRGEQGNSK